jgi:hypothetical protein
MFEIPFTPQQLLIGGVTFIALLFIVVVFPIRNTSATPYQRLTSILTPSEQHFYKVLSSTINGQAIIMVKVRIADLLKVRSTIKQKHFWSYFSKISQKHIDFVLIDPTTFKTICLIELDDKSHLRLGRSNRDKFVNRIMAQTGIPLYRFRVQRRYDRSDISQTLSSCLNN